MAAEIDLIMVYSWRPTDFRVLVQRERDQLWPISPLSKAATVLVDAYSSAGLLGGVVESIGVHGDVAAVTTTLRAGRRVAVARIVARACLALEREPGIVRRVLVVSRRGRVLESCSP
jgi:hypothetical protein